MKEIEGRKLLKVYSGQAADCCWGGRRRSRVVGIWWPFVVEETIWACSVSRSVAIFTKTTACPKKNTQDIVLDSIANRFVVYFQFAGDQISKVLAFVAMQRVHVQTCTTATRVVPLMRPEKTPK